MRYELQFALTHQGEVALRHGDLAGAEDARAELSVRVDDGQHCRPVEADLGNDADEIPLGADDAVAHGDVLIGAVVERQRRRPAALAVGEHGGGDEREVAPLLLELQKLAQELIFLAVGLRLTLLGAKVRDLFLSAAFSSLSVVVSS